MRDFFRSPLFRCLVCLILVCCILVNVSPIRAKALPLSTWVWLEASMVFASLFAGLGVSPVDELAEGFADTCNACWDFISLNYDFVTDDEKIAVWSTGSDELPFMVDQELIEAVRGWLWDSGTIIEDEAASGMAYYNNWYLPVISSPSTYMLIDYNSETEVFRLYITSSASSNFFVRLSNGVSITHDSAWIPDGLYGYYEYSVGDTTWTHSAGGQKPTWGITINTLCWSNQDIYVEDGSALYFAGSTPSNTQTISTEDYLSLGYVAPSEMDFPAGYSTWTAGAISVPGAKAEEGEETVVVPLSIPGTAADVYSFAQTDVWTGANTAADVIAQAVPITGTDTADPTVPVDPEAIPEDIAPYTFSLNDIFPFCIPFDLYDFLTCLDAEPVAPVINWQLQLPGGSTYPITIDLSAFDSVAQLLRRLELLVFCIALGLKTRDLIKG